MKIFHWNKLSIQTHILIFFILFVLITLALLGLVQVVFLDTFYKNIRLSETQKLADTIAGKISADSLSELQYDHEWDSDVLEIIQNNEADIMITDASGTPYYSKITFTPKELFFEILNEQRKAEYIEKAKNGDGYTSGYVLTNYSDNRTMDSHANMLYASIIRVGDEDGVIFVYCRLVPVSSTVRTLKSQYLLISLMLILVAAVFATIVAKRISKPIRRITLESAKLMSGSFDLKLDDSGYSEIAQLNNALIKTSADLQRNERLQRELIANISHDLRTPITLIQGYAEMIRDLPNGFSRENMQVILDETHYLSELVNDILDLSKIQSGAITYNDERLNLTETTRNLMNRYNHLRESQGFVILFEYDRDAYVFCDELRITQVLYNLINNAVNYSGEDKKVRIVQEISEETVKYSVIDTGKGIPEDKLQDIWERYYKVDDSHVRAQMGTGLGLSIVKSILMHYDAKFGVISSTKPGESGSTFWFEIKLSPEN